MRSINFRANIKGTDIVGDVKEIDFTFGLVLITFISEDGPRTCRYGLSEVTLLQHTGLHDKNGHEIWEGDVLGWSVNGKAYTMGFENGAFDLIDFDCYGHEQTAAFEDKDEWKVIGNIYENPSLLTHP